MWAIDWEEMGCTQYASTLEDAHKIGQRGGIFYIITYMGESNGQINRYYEREANVEVLDEHKVGNETMVQRDMSTISLGNGLCY